MKRIRLIYGVIAILLVLVCWGLRLYLPECNPELFKVSVFVCATLALFNVKWSVPRTIIYCTLACLFYECLDLLFLNPINWIRIISLLIGTVISIVTYFILHSLFFSRNI